MSLPDERVPPLPTAPPSSDGTPIAPLHYRAPGPEPESQWITDDDPKHRWFILLLMILFPLMLVLGVLESLFGLVRMIFRW